MSTIYPSPAAVVLLLYIVMSGPMNYCALIFIATFVRKHRLLLEKGLSRNDRRDLVGELMDADSRIPPSTLFMFGGLMLPMAVLLTVLVVAWYFGKVTRSLKDSDTPA